MLALRRHNNKQVPAQPRAFNNNHNHTSPQQFMSPVNGIPAAAPQLPVGASGLPPNKVIEKGGARVLCIADVRGHLRTLNELAKKANADYILHTGDFGFYDESSLDRIAEKTLKHVVQYSPLLEQTVKTRVTAPNAQNIKNIIRHLPNALSELPLFLNSTYTLDVPVYTVWGACEDVRVLEKFRSGEYKINNLHIIDEANSRLLEVGGVKLRLLGLGGAVVMHKLFDNGEGRTTIAGGQGTMWTTILQMGELVDTANRVYDASETRVFLTHNSPAREGLLNQLSVELKADFSISAGLHFRYGSSYNEFSVNPSLDHYRGKLASSHASFKDVWETVKGEVQPAVAQNEAQKQLLDNALRFIEKMPSNANGGNPFGGPTANAAPGAGQIDESAFKNMWNFNLADAAFGYLVLEIENGRIGTEMRAQGFNFSHRAGKNTQGGHTPAQPQNIQQQAQSPAPISPAVPPTGPRAKVPQTSQPSASPVQERKPTPKPTPPPRIEPAVPAMPISKPSTPKPTTPAPAVAPAAEEKSTAAEEPKSNGKATEPSTEAAETKPTDETTTVTSPPPTTSAPLREKQHGLYINAVESRDAVLDLIPAEFHESIRVEEKFSRVGNRPFFLAFMESEDLATDCYAKIDEKFKHSTKGQAPFVKLMDDDYNRRDAPGGQGQRGGNRGGFGGEGRDRSGMNASRWGRSGEMGAGGNTSESDGNGRQSRGGKRGSGYQGRGGSFDGGNAGRGGMGRGRGGRRGGMAGGRGQEGGAASPAPQA